MFYKLYIPALSIMNLKFTITISLCRFYNNGRQYMSTDNTLVQWLGSVRTQNCFQVSFKGKFQSHSLSLNHCFQHYIHYFKKVPSNEVNVFQKYTARHANCSLRSGSVWRMYFSFVTVWTMKTKCHDRSN